MAAEIINYGRGPAIAGTRITVYTIMDYLKMGWQPAQIAADLEVTADEVIAAVQYIEEHQEEVAAAYQRILERAANARNPPWVEAIRAKGHEKLLARMEELRQAKLKENADARNGTGQ